MWSPFAIFTAGFQQGKSVGSWWKVISHGHAPLHLMTCSDLFNDCAGNDMISQHGHVIFHFMITLPSNRVTDPNSGEDYLYIPFYLWKTSFLPQCPAQISAAVHCTYCLLFSKLLTSFFLKILVGSSYLPFLFNPFTLPLYYILILGFRWRIFFKWILKHLFQIK